MSRIAEINRNLGESIVESCKLNLLSDSKRSLARSGLLIVAGVGALATLGKIVDIVESASDQPLEYVRALTNACMAYGSLVTRAALGISKPSSIIEN